MYANSSIRKGDRDVLTSILNSNKCILGILNIINKVGGVVSKKIELE